MDATLPSPELRREREDRLERQQAALLALSRDNLLQTGDLRTALGRITETIAHTLGVSRVSVWKYSEDRTSLICLDLFELASNEHRHGMKLRSAEFPAYFASLETTEIINAEDAASDPRTAEFSATYLPAFGIRSMMDVPIRIFGRLDGVLCHEQVGAKRRWASDEQVFAMAAANFAALAEEQWQRQEMQLALREEESRFRQLADNIREVFWMVDVQAGEVVYVSPAFERVWGIPSADLRKHPELALKAIHPDDRIRFEGAQDRQCRGESTTTEYRILRPDGSVRWIRDRGTPIMDPQGQLWRVVGLAEDITERKADEDRLALHAHIVANMKECVFLFDPEETIVYANPAAETMFGFEPGELVGKNARLLNSYPKEENDRVVSAVTKELLSKGCWSGEFRSHRKDGTPFSTRALVTVLQLGDRTLALSVHEDVTQIRRAEEQVRLLLESTGEGIIGIDPKGECTFINRAACAMLGLHPAETIGRRLHELVQTNGERPIETCDVPGALCEGVQAADADFQRNDGTSISVEYSSYPIRTGQKTEGAVVLFKDVTKAKQLEEQYRQAQRMEAVGRLAGGVAHDFNNLLTIINGYSQILLGTLSETERARQFVDEIRKAGERAAGLTRQLLAFSRKQILQPKVVDLNSLLADMKNMLGRLLGEDVRIDAEYGSDLRRIKADVGQIEQVVMNLAVNARDAMPTGGRLRIETANIDIDDAFRNAHPDAQPGRYVRIRIADTGCGMEPQVLSRIFEPFFTTKPQGKGTGLGLATVYGIVRQSSGYVFASSEVGVGSTFDVYLPEYVETPEPAEETSPAAVAAGGRETILLVEDEAGVRMLTRRVLQGHGYTVIEAGSGAEALGKAASLDGPIHLLVTDVVMPEMSGHELARRLALARPDARILYMSGYTDDAVMRHGIQQDATHFIQKPFALEQLSRKVREVLDMG